MSRAIPVNTIKINPYFIKNMASRLFPAIIRKEDNPKFTMIPNAKAVPTIPVGAV